MASLENAAAQDEVYPSDKVADLVELIVCGLVDEPDALAIDVVDDADGSVIEVHCAPDDVGKVIGRRGRSIKAIRILARALASRLGVNVDVEVLG